MWIKESGLYAYLVKYYFRAEFLYTKYIYMRIFKHILFLNKKVEFPGCSKSFLKLIIQLCILKYKLSHKFYEEVLFLLS